MRKNLVLITIIILITLLLAPAVLAQAPSTEDLVAAYVAATNEALASGDSAEWLTLYADDAVMSVPALAPQPVTGGEMIGAAMFPGIMGAVGGATVTIVQATYGDDSATVYNMYLGGASGDFPIEELFEYDADGLITSHIVNVGVTAPEAEVAETTEAAPAALPETGGAGLNLLPGLLVLGGAALVGLGRRFSSR